MRRREKMDIQINFSIEKLHDFKSLVDVIQRDNDRENRYKMSLSELLKILSTSTTMGARNESPFLPNNCCKYVETSMGYEVYIEIPKKKWMINFNGNIFEVGFPRLIFKYDCVRLNGNEKGFRVELSKILAVKGNQTIKGDTPLYKFPYSHVESSGNVCMGGNSIGDIECLSELENKHNIFFHSPFSTDWGAKTKLGLNVAVLFSSNFNQKEFDDEVLLPTEKSFNEFFMLGQINTEN